MSAQVSITAPTIEQHATGFGIGVATPRLSWRFLVGDDNLQDWEQLAYDIDVLRLPESTQESYHIKSSESVLVPWPSKPLQSRESARVRVRAYGTVGGQAQKEPTPWSPWTTLETALLERNEWKAIPIGSNKKEITDGALRPVRFRRIFTLADKSIERARLYITSLGVYHVYINGKRVGDHCMAPGWTSYDHHLNYQVFDVAPLLIPGGQNNIVAEVGEGWYATRLGFLGGNHYIYGNDLALIAQLEVQSAMGSNLMLSTDSSWTTRPSAIVGSELYDGELYDAREDYLNWTVDLDDADGNWKPVRTLDFPRAELIAPDAPPVRVIEKVKPVNIIQTPSGKTIVDFGQNLVGRLLVPSLSKPKDHHISFQHAEVLEHGELGTRPLREAKCTDEVISNGETLKDWSPKFTFHGFRYVQVNGWSPADKDDPLQISSLFALVLHTDLQRTGWFSCSNNMVNKLHNNALWSMRGNFLSIPTDCPQRDERLGWTGDITVFSPSANFLYNTSGMVSGWIRDVAA